MPQLRDNLGRFTTNKKNGKNPTTNADYMKIAAFNEAVYNVTLSRKEFISRFLDPRRDINDECGYPATSNMTAERYRDLYDREAIAARVVDVLPEESWMIQPEVFETEDNEQETPFEKAWKELDNSLRGQSFYQDEKGSPVWEHLKRADKLSGVGAFGVILLGIDDGKDLREPIDGINERGEFSESPPERKLLYIRSFDESLVQITQYERDPTNPRS
jgi:hypothetical protein